MTIYRATLSGHNLWIIASGSGSWYLCITGRKPIQEDQVFDSLDLAKRTAHSLAHWHIEGNRDCNCAAELRWETASAAHITEDAGAPAGNCTLRPAAAL